MPLSSDPPHLSETTSPALAATPPHPQWMYQAAWLNKRDCGDTWWPGERKRVIDVREQERETVYHHQPSY